MVEHLISDDRGVFIAALMGDIEAKVDAVKLVGEFDGQFADRAGRSTFRRCEPDEIAVGLLLDDGEPGRERYGLGDSVRLCLDLMALSGLRAAYESKSD